MLLAWSSVSLVRVSLRQKRYLRKKRPIKSLCATSATLLLLPRGTHGVVMPLRLRYSSEEEYECFGNKKH